MANNMRVLFGIPTKSHIEITLDELYGLEELGYVCDQFEYGGRNSYKSSIARFYIIFVNAIKLLLKTYKFKPDFIYLNSRVEFVASVRDFITILILKLFYYKKVEFLIKSHGSDVEVLQTNRLFFKKVIFPFLRRHIRGWLFLSREELNWIISNKLLDDNKVFLAKNIVRVDKFHVDNNFKKKFNIPFENKILLFVGRIIKEKGIHYVIDAFAEIRGMYKVTLIIVGDGEELDAVKDKINSLNIKEDVMLTGWIDESLVTYYTSNSDLLIFPTYFPEGFPMALFNSMAAGLSILTTPIRASLDYLQEPNNCLWVEPQSSISIKNGLIRLLNDEDLMKQMRKNNKQKVHLFSRNFVSEELSNILTTIKINGFNKSFKEVHN